MDRLICLLLILGWCVALDAGDWPRYGRDGERSLHSADPLPLPLAKAWVFATHAPSPSFRFDRSGGYEKLETVTYDLGCHPIVVGERVFVATSTEDTLYCLERETGAVRWAFTAEGPLRLAPTWADGRVYFSSDDGYAYCLSADDGSLVWKQVGARHPERRMIANGRLVGYQPVRTDVAIADGVAYLASGLVGNHGTRITACDAVTGQVLWRRDDLPGVDYVDGYILVQGRRLVLGMGRSGPLVLDRATGDVLGQGGAGGSHLNQFEQIVAIGPNEHGVLRLLVSPEDLGGRQEGSRGFGPGATAFVPGVGSFTGLKAARIIADDDQLYILHLAESTGGAGIRAAGAIARQTLLLAVPKKPAIQAIRDSAAQLESRNPPHWHRQNGSEGVLLKELFEARAWFAPLADDETAAMIVAGGMVCVGGADRIRLFDTADGEEATPPVAVRGVVRELSAAGGALFAGTDAGRVYCLRKDAPAAVDEQPPAYASPYPRDDRLAPVYQEAAQLAAAAAPSNKRGFCLVLGAGEGRLAYAISQASDMTIVGIERDPVKAATARAKLRQAGVYGKRVSILVDSGNLAACPETFANVITSEQLLVDGDFPDAPSEVFRRLTPYGGAVLLGRQDGLALDLAPWRGPELSAWETLASVTGAAWCRATRGALPGAGQWDHPNANAANTACSEDRLVGAANLRVQWLGTMGPEHVVNRHLSPVAPLFQDGRLFVVGRNRVLGIDAYNGAPLWTREIPDVHRIMVQLNTGQFCANTARLFVAARGSCLALEPASGELKETHQASLPGCDWGYLAVAGDVLVGSSQTPDPAVSQDDRESNARVFLDAAAGGSARAWPVVSRQLFARTWQDGALLWTYGQGDRLILNRSLCLADGRIYLVESRSPDVLKAAAEDRVLLRSLTARDAYHTALDLRTGKPVWEKPLGDLVADHTLNQCCQDGVLVLLRSHFDAEHFAHYTLHGLESATGNMLWSNDLAYTTPGIGTMTNLHNRTLTQPTLVGNAVLLATTSYQGGRRGLQAFHLRTGQRDERFGNYDQQKGCAPISASAAALFHRGYQCAAYDLQTKTNLDVSSATRPSCWISMIPAGGLLLMPEGSHGCDCGQNLQTSLALAAEPLGTNP